MTVPDLSAISVVDNHCHAITRDQGSLDLPMWRSLFTESDGPATRTHHVAYTAAYRRIIIDLARWLNVPPTEADVFAARQNYTPSEWCSNLLNHAGVQHLLLDDGYPPPPTFDRNEHSQFVSGRAFHILRLEPVIETLLGGRHDVDELAHEVQKAIRLAAGNGAVGVKSAIAYRSGLAVQRWPTWKARRELDRVQRRGEYTGVYRIEGAPLHDTLLHAALEAANELTLPFQFHVGYGDRDVDMRVGRPEHLRDVLEDPAYQDLPIVLLHECYPFTAMGAWLAAIYDNVWLDLSFAIPLLSLSEMIAFTRQALAVAPWTKLLYSSDAIKIPEFHWAGARHGRRTLATALKELVEAGDLRESDLEDVAERILAQNAIDLYRLA